MNFLQQLTDLLPAVAQSRSLSKGEYLLREGAVENYIYFIDSGAVRAYLLSDTEEITIRFGYEGSFINSLASFIKQEPSEFYLQAIRKTELRFIDRASFHSFARQNEENILAYTALLELLVTQQMEREIDLLTSAPAERLKRVLDRSPNLFQQIPMKYIASYLRMTPETLSRIRYS